MKEKLAFNESVFKNKCVEKSKQVELIYPKDNFDPLEYGLQKEGVNIQVEQDDEFLMPTKLTNIDNQWRWLSYFYDSGGIGSFLYDVLTGDVYDIVYDNGHVIAMQTTAIMGISGSARSK